MAIDPRIALAGVRPSITLDPFERSLARGLEFRTGLSAYEEQMRQQAAAGQVRQAFAQQYGGGQPAGLAGAAPSMAPSNGGGAFPPLAEQEAAAQHQALYGTPPPSASSPAAGVPSGSPPGLAGLSGQMGGGGQAPADPVSQYGAGRDQGQRAFVGKLYTIDPKAAMAYEQHLTATTRAQSEAQDAQMKANVARVEFLGRVADGVLESESPQQAWEVGRAMLIEQGMPPSQVPGVYDPSFVKQLSGMARDATDKYNAGMLRVAQAKEQRARTEAGASIPNYGLGDKLNAAVFATSGPEIAPGQFPTPAQVQTGRQRLIDEERAADEAKQEGRVEVAAATGAQAAQARTVSETAQKRLAALDTAGLAAQDTHTSLDEIDRLIDAGVYGNSPVDRAAMLAYGKGLRPNDTKAQHTTRLREVGNQLILARGSLGSNVSNTDAAIYAKAAGNFQQAKNVQEMRESIKSMRTILNKAVDYANKGREAYEKTGTLPPFEGRPAAGPPQPLPRTVEDIDREIADIERQLQGQ